MKLNVAIITHNTLEALGIKHVLEMSFSIVAHIYTSISDIPETRIDLFDYYFCDSSDFAINLDFFLPRKQKVIMVCNISSPESIKSICRNDNESYLIDRLNTLFSTADKKNNENQAELSQREIEVLRLIASGLINKEIASELGISINTVLTHRKNITSKLGIRSVSGLSFYAMMNGIIAPK